MLDTSGIDPDDRTDAVAEAARAAAAPQYVIPEHKHEPIRARFDVWDLGGAGIYRIVHCSGVRMVRTERQVRSGPSEVLLIARRETGVARRECAGAEDLIRPGELFAVDLNAPYDIGWRGDGAHTSLLVPLEQLALPTETIRRATARVHASPLCRVVSSVIASMTDNADALAADAAARETGSACVELVRALLTSAAGTSAGDGGAVPAEMLLTEVREYIRRNLSHPDLGAEMIARAHHVSARYLYKLCASADFRLEQWIIDSRLDRARADLARPENARKSIASIAGSWGFRDPSHFSRRFRAAYGITPRDWRRVSAAHPDRSGI